MSNKDCSDALGRLYEYIDKELPVEDISSIAEHLSTCTPCDEERRINEKIRSMVSACAGECAPEHLRARVLETLKQARDEQQNATA